MKLQYCINVICTWRFIIGQGNFLIVLQTPLCSGAISSLGQPDGVNVSRYSVANSQSSLIHSVQPSDCTSAGFVLGGVTMKMMDEVAGIVAFRHCKSNVVTASIGTCEFLIV